MVTIIFGENRQRAFEKILSLYENIPKEEILLIKKSSFFIEIFLKNGDVIKTASANDSSRGLKFNIAYIDKFISQEIIQNVLLPFGKANCQIRYF